MKKRILTLIVLGVLSLLALCSCISDSGDGNSSIPGSGSSNESKIFKSFVYKNVTIDLDTDYKPIIDKLGNPTALEEVPSCAFPSEIAYRIVYGDDIEMAAEPISGNKTHYIYSIVITNEDLKTPEGIGLGNSFSEAVAVYGSNYTQKGEAYVYTQGKEFLYLFVRDDIITQIQYLFDLELT